METLAVLGAGAWGTALAFQLARANPQVTINLWGHSPQQQRELQRLHCNVKYFPEYHFPQQIQPVVELADAVNQVAGIVIAVPSLGFNSLIQQLLPSCPTSLPILSATKGLDPVSEGFFHELLPVQQHFAILSGPSFAGEVMRELPTAITIAATEFSFAQFWQNYLHGDFFRVYTTDDIIGVQLAGTIKNILGIATGIADGLGFGANTRAALITRGLAEMMRLNHELGGKQSTLMGLAGVGDLVLTCTDNQSRNRRFGIALGNGKSIEAAQHEVQQVVEGYVAAKLVHDLSQRYKIEMPICDVIYAVLYKHLRVKQAIQELLSRAPKEE